MFVTVDVFDDRDRRFRAFLIRKANVQAVGPLTVLPTLDGGLRCRKVLLLTGLWFYVHETDIPKLTT